MYKLPDDIIQHILDFVPKDKFCKSPIADLINDDPYYGNCDDLECEIIYDGNNDVRKIRTNSFYLMRLHVLDNVHSTDFYLHGFSDAYDSVLNPILRKQMLEFYELDSDPKKRQHHEAKQWWLK